MSLFQETKQKELELARLGKLAQDRERELAKRVAQLKNQEENFAVLQALTG